jgi:hypothetical protein
MATRTVIKRHQYADYLNCGTTETPDYQLCGAGFTALNETPGAQSESVKYVNEVAASSSVVGYETQFPFEAEQISSEAAINKIYEVGRNHLVGEDAETEYIRVELWKHRATDDVYAARKFIVSIEVSSIEGENKMTLSGNLNAVGDPVDGWFDPVEKVFTPSTTTP